MGVESQPKLIFLPLSLSQIDFHFLKILTIMKKLLEGTKFIGK